MIAMKRKMKPAKILFGLALLTVFWAAGTGAVSRFSLSHYQSYRVRQLLEIVNRGGPVSHLRVQFPLLMTEHLPPYQTLRSFTIAPAAARREIRLRQSANGQSAALELGSLPRGGRFLAEFSYTLFNAAIDYHLERCGGSDYGDPAFLKPEAGIEVGDPSLRALAAGLTRGCSNQLEKARRVFAFVNSRLTYDPARPGRHSAVLAWQRKRGVCTDFSLLYIALCRAAGIPSRFVAGFRFNPRKMGSAETDLAPYAHAWAESYLPGLGWTVVDPTSLRYQNGARVADFDFFGRIAADDCHLFASFDKDERINSTYIYAAANPARLQIGLRTTIRKQ